MIGAKPRRPTDTVLPEAETPYRREGEMARERPAAWSRGPPRAAGHRAGPHRAGMAGVYDGR